MPAKKSTAMTFGCLQCGAPFEVYPPDTYHTELKMEPCKEGDSIPLNLTCEKCKTKNTRYWDIRHLHFSTLN